MTIPSQQVPQNLFSFPAYIPPQFPSDITRKLCGAAYVDSNFATEVIREVVEDEHRAVAPSFGFDLDPVVRHCFRARRLLILRDAAVALLVLLGLVFAFFITAAWLAIGFAVLAVQSPTLRHRLSPVGRYKLVGALSLAAVVFCCAGVVISALLGGFGGNGETGYDGYGYDGYGNVVDNDSVPSLFGVSVFAPVVLAVLAFGVLFAVRHKGYSVLTRELVAGRPPIVPALGSERIARRVAMVASLQRGNITVHEKDPFLGAGTVQQGWSFALSLRPSPAGRTTTVGAPVSDDRPPADRCGPVELDPVALNDRIREAVLRLRDESLPEGARVPGLYIVPHVVADGVREMTDPLLHPQVRVPYALASPEAIAAIIRHPQGGLRYYQRVVVGGVGKLVRTGDGRPVMPAQSLGIDVSAFIHVALEGGMLYAEFMATVMPPVQAKYELVDALRPDRVTGRTFRDTLRLFVTDVAAGPWRLGRNLWHVVTTSWRMSQANRDAEEFRAYDYGARLSVRQLAAEPELSKFLQTLDEWKYSKLLSRTLSETIIEFLAEHDVDTAEFRRGVEHVQNVYGTVNNITGSQVAFGDQNTFSQVNMEVPGHDR